ncbi:MULTISPECIES: CDGSH iron-sulfur domain-containing protein [unclassified Nocardioides]|uniref:CDGSH iron-sulfur domain-containing protein n=1 Tax=unclassified Nocardioides TaxID=2615069 RepID=UPI0006F4E22B|nr:MULTISPECIES: CDGSH iron-sulfur domain-containing protein [unclassified Nocardioides]KQY51630.1 hypothetical protein ASD30_19885 [Nocardioides sp. Root140]KQZ70694.1 hypothetical protein ASD66_14040 [Nocardioides sp. Root151]KRF10968.1 hypothetical protein ASH02_19205 [Nocardioides sp. Soil796]
MSEVPTADAQDVRTQACPGGPLLVRGAATWVDSDGIEHPVTRPVVAVCRCERSQRLPWCDGTHKFVTRTAPSVA